MRRTGQRAVSRVVFDDPNLISTAGLVPAMALAQKAHLAELADIHTSIPTDKGANAGAKVFSLVAGMVAGADSIDDMSLLRHGAMSKTLERPYAPSTLGSFLRSFAFGHVRQLDAVASRFLTGLATHTQILEGVDDQLLVDIDDTIKKSTDHVRGRLVVRRIPDLNTKAGEPQAALFDTWRFHAFFTTTDPKQVDTVAADKTHRQHAIIEKVHADLKNSALAHLPSGRFTANGAWLVLAAMAFNLTRAAASVAGSAFARSATATVRRTLINVPARIASSGRRLTLHLPQNWPWQSGWTRLFARVCGPPGSTAT